MAGSTRRQFVSQVVWSTMGTSLVFAAGACARRSDAPAVRTEPPAAGAALAFFTPAQFETVSAACERLLPEDEDPGAISLGVPGYVDRALAEAENARWRQPILDGLAALDAKAQERGKRFHELDAAAQDELLRQSQQPGGQKGFVRRLLHLTLEGAFGDPLHGGNRDLGGWKMIGFVGEPCGPKGLAQIKVKRT